MYMVKLVCFSISPHTIYMYSLLPLRRLRVSRYYHLCRSHFSFLTLFLYISLHFNSIYVENFNLKELVSRGDFSCSRRIFYCICYCLYRSKKSAFTRAPYCLLWLCTCITWGAKLSKNGQKQLSNIPSFDWAINPLFSTIKSITLLIQNQTPGLFFFLLPIWFFWCQFGQFIATSHINPMMKVISCSLSTWGCFIDFQI